MASKRERKPSNIYPYNDEGESEYDTAAVEARLRQSTGLGLSRFPPPRDLHEELSGRRSYTSYGRGNLNYYGSPQTTNTRTHKPVADIKETQEKLKRFNATRVPRMPKRGEITEEDDEELEIVSERLISKQPPVVTERSLESPHVPDLLVNKRPAERSESPGSPNIVTIFKQRSPTPEGYRPVFKKRQVRKPIMPQRNESPKPGNEYSTAVPGIITIKKFQKEGPDEPGESIIARQRREVAERKAAMNALQHLSSEQTVQIRQERGNQAFVINNTSNPDSPSIVEYTSDCSSSDYSPDRGGIGYNPLGQRQLPKPTLEYNRIRRGRSPTPRNFSTNSRLGSTKGTVGDGFNVRADAIKASIAGRGYFAPPNDSKELTKSSYYNGIRPNEAKLSTTNLLDGPKVNISNHLNTFQEASKGVKLNIPNISKAQTKEATIASPVPKHQFNTSASLFVPQNDEQQLVVAKPKQEFLKVKKFKVIGAPVKYTPEYLAKLRSLAHPPGVLVKHGYTLKDNLTIAQAYRRKRCRDCKKIVPRSNSSRIEKPQTTPRKTFNTKQTDPRILEELMATLDVNAATSKPVMARQHIESGSSRKVKSLEYNTSSFKVQYDSDTSEDVIDLTTPPLKTVMTKEEASMEKYGCAFHPGALIDDTWSCCSLPYTSPPCVNRGYHIPLKYDDSALLQNWSFTRTPFSKPPFGQNIRAAVALDCEMGVSITGEPELIRISLIDYFTSEILIDSLVSPNVEMAHYNTRYSGVTHDMMARARENGKAIGGRDAARQQVWKYVGPETVVIMHGGKSDMDCLRWYHYWIVDTHVVEIEGDDGSNNNGGVSLVKKGDRSLKSLALARLGRCIQGDTDGGGEMSGHDSVEDALAARDLADWAVENL